MSRENCINRLQTDLRADCSFIFSDNRLCPVLSLKYSNEPKRRNFNDGFSFTV